MTDQQHRPGGAPESITSLLYVSKSRLAVPAELDRVDDIVAESRRWNPAHQITGALLFTHAYFAQLLEGPAAEIDVLLARIRGDDRHADVEVVDRRGLTARRFGEWSMAYSGPSFFMSQLVQPLVGRQPGAHLAREVDRLARMMRDLARRG